MSSITSIVRAGKGRSHGWRVIPITTRIYQGNPGLGKGFVVFTAELWHYSTKMLVWDSDNPTVPLYYDIGNGSVSDQNGMNKAFRELGMPYYYSRAGGAEIRHVSI